MKEYDKLPAGRRRICDGSSGLPLEKVNQYREKWGLAHLEEINSSNTKTKKKSKVLFKLVKAISGTEGNYECNKCKKCVTSYGTPEFCNKCDFVPNPRNIPDKKPLNNEKLSFISMPRSGTHWFKHIVELVINKGANDQRYYKNLNGIWCDHSHGMNNIDNKQIFNGKMVLPKTKKILYLSRNIVDVVYSWGVLSSHIMTIPNIKKMAIFLKKHYDYYKSLENNEEYNIHYFTYEEMVNSPLPTLEGVFDFIGEKYNSTDIHKALTKVTKYEVQSHSKSKTIADTTDRYQTNKKEFVDVFSELIEKAIS